VNSQRRDAEQVSDDNAEIEWMDAHATIFPAHWANARKIRVMIVTAEALVKQATGLSAHCG